MFLIFCIARRHQAYIMYTALPNFYQAEKNGHRTGTERNEGKKRRTQRKRKRKEMKVGKRKRDKSHCVREKRKSH